MVAKKNAKNGFDDIFAATAEAAAPAADAPRPATRKAAPAPAGEVDSRPAEILRTAWKAHEAEVLYRKAREDKVLFFSVAMLVALVLGAAAVLGAGLALDWHWLGRLIFRVAFAAFALALVYAGLSLIELNRKRLQDVLATIVKIQDTLGLFTEGAIPGHDGAYFPNTYKFVGSLNDDETNYAQMVLKVAAAAAILTILFLV